MSGNIRPQSRSMMLPSTSMQAQFRPISPSPPRKTTLTGSGKGHAEVLQYLASLVLESRRRGSHRQAALPRRQPQHPEYGLGGNGVGGEVAGLERPRLGEAGVDGP